MFRYSIENHITGKMYGAQFKSKVEGDAWKQEQISKGSWGKPDRWERFGKDRDGNENPPKPGYTKSRQVQVEVQPDVFEAFDEYFYPVEYTIVEEDLSQDVQWVESQVAKKRASEYAKIDHLLKEALVEKELGDNSKWLEYVELRQAIKTKYPKS